MAKPENVRAMIESAKEYGIYVRTVNNGGNPLDNPYPFDSIYKY